MDLKNLKLIDKMTHQQADIAWLGNGYFLAWVDEAKVSGRYKKYAGINSARIGHISDLVELEKKGKQ